MSIVLSAGRRPPWTLFGDTRHLMNMMAFVAWRKTKKLRPRLAMYEARMPNYLPKDARGVSPAPFPGRDGLPEVDWSELERPFGRRLNEYQRAAVSRALLFYSAMMSDQLNAPTARAVLRVLGRIESAVDNPEDMEELLRAPTEDPVLNHARWSLFQRHKAPPELGPEWLYLLKKERRDLQDREDLRNFLRKKPDPILIEGVDSEEVAVDTKAEPGLRQKALSELVGALADLWTDAGLEVGARKDSQKAFNFVSSPFVLFVDHLLKGLPISYRRQSAEALATEISKILRVRTPR